MSYRTERNENSMIGTFPFSLWVFVGTHAQIMRPNAAIWNKHPKQIHILEPPFPCSSFEEHWVGGSGPLSFSSS